MYLPFDSVGHSSLVTLETVLTLSSREPRPGSGTSWSLPVDLRVLTTSGKVSVTSSVLSHSVPLGSVFYRRDSRRSLPLVRPIQSGDSPERGLSKEESRHGIGPSIITRGRIMVDLL